MEQSVNKTIMCSVFFLDIVEYSKRSVSGQISLKERFNAFLSEAISHVPVNDRIILDTGDGAVVNFLGDVEDALRAALSMRASLLSEEGTRDPALLVRMGVNLGPVRQVRDINGQPNVVGDGINVAQRVMGFASSGQILVSRSYFDAASRLSPDYAGMFHYQGSRTDKHVREHEVYAIGYLGDKANEVGEQSSTKHRKTLAVIGKIQYTLQTTRARSAQYLLRSSHSFSQLSYPKKTLLMAGAAVPLIFLLILSLWGGLENEASKSASIASVPVIKVENVAQSAVKTTQSVSAVASNKLSLPAAIIKPVLPIQKEKTPPVIAKAQPTVVKPSPPVKIAEPAKPAVVARSTESVNAAPAIVNLTVQPWGEVYLDGRMIDVSPPLNQLKVSAGNHVIEIRNTTFPVYKEKINVKAGDKISVRHKFSN